MAKTIKLFTYPWWNSTPQEHITRICRIIQRPSGNAMLIGVGGSGKQSLSRLAAFICGFEVRQLSVTSKFKVWSNRWNASHGGPWNYRYTKYDDNDNLAQEVRADSLLLTLGNFLLKPLWDLRGKSWRIWTTTTASTTPKIPSYWGRASELLCKGAYDTHSMMPLVLLRAHTIDRRFHKPTLAIFFIEVPGSQKA